MKFDMILFEHLHSAKNHWKDVHIIARLLCSVGWNVAILDLYHDIQRNEIYGIPIIRPTYKGSIPCDDFIYKNINGVKRIIFSIRYCIQQHKYMKNIYEEIKDMADSFYIGSYLFFPTIVFMNINKPCYYWGLRSNVFGGLFDLFRNHMIIQAPYLLFAKYLFLKNKHQQMFVSNEIIKNEFVQRGIPDTRLIIREERPYEINNKVIIKDKNDQKTFMVIGLLRPEKHVIETINAFKAANVDNSILLVVGKCKDRKYEELIDKEILNIENIKRIKGYIEEEEFHNYFYQSDYVIFADEKGSCCITNGTMQESLMHYTPVIVPNYNPYTYYMKKNKIGIEYNYDDLNSLAEAIRNACNIDKRYFSQSIASHLNSIDFNKVAQLLSEQIEMNIRQIAAE